MSKSAIPYMGLTLSGNLMECSRGRKRDGSEYNYGVIYANGETYKVTDYVKPADVNQFDVVTVQISCRLFNGNAYYTAIHSDDPDDYGFEA